MYTKELFGKEVLDVNANSIGKVADIDVNMQKGIINHIIVKAGLVKKYVISLEQIDKIGDKIILKSKGDELKRK